MELYKVRDVVREQVGGADALSEASLTWAVERGLREIEKTNNWYWMEAIKDFTLTINQGEYRIYTSTSNGLNIPNWKDSRVLLTMDATLTHPFWDEVEGPKIAEDFVPRYATDDRGIPKFWYKDEQNTEVMLNLLPPDPDKAYTMKWYYWQWTSLPTDITSDDHEVLMRWPEALIYLATEQGMILKTKDLNAGKFWRQLYKNDNRAVDSEYSKIQRYNDARSHSTKIVLSPQPGASARNRDRFRGGNY